MNAIHKLIDKYKVTLSPQSVNQFISIVERKKYQKDEIILKQGLTSRYMYFIEQGIIRQFYFKEGRDITEHFSCEGDIATCLESLFLKEPTHINIEAIETSIIYRINYEKFKILSNKYPEINCLYQAILEYKLIVSQKKADSWRFENSHDRYKRFCKEFPIVSKRVSIAHIASYLLMTPETLSRVRAVI
ncbi:Crp/Fnr family transcriptional regulator [Apibacter raozihei]|uniref:Crp/Fnr family transcriptional regulator n=1 Tax=Apibacter raozihei TaxID=2500547 RepID=UPI000FE35538|nr:Crp/Fnr family transcriptional regulator [Apibacter raozihei]